MLGTQRWQDVASDLEGEDTAGRLLAEKVTTAEREGAPGPWQLREESQASPGAAGRAGDHRAEPRAEAAGSSMARGGAGSGGCSALPRGQAASRTPVRCCYQVSEADLDSRTRLRSSVGDLWPGWDRGNVSICSRHLLLS